MKTLFIDVLSNETNMLDRGISVIRNFVSFIYGSFLFSSCTYLVKVMYHNGMDQNKNNKYCKRVQPAVKLKHKTV